MHMRLRSQRRSKPSPNFSLEKIVKKKKGRRVNAAAVQQAVAAQVTAVAVAASAVPVQPTVAHIDMMPRVVLHNVLASTLGMPMWQPRVVLQRLSDAQQHSVEELEEPAKDQQMEDTPSRIESPPTVEVEVPRRVQKKRKGSDDDEPSSKRRKIWRPSSLASASKPLSLDEGYDASDEYSSERSSPIPETLFLASQMEQMEESEEEGLSLEDVAEEQQQDRPMALEDGAVVEEEEEGLKFLFKPFREAMKLMKERERRRRQEFQNR